MKIAARIIIGVILGNGSWASHAQVPSVIGTWKLNVAASKFPEPAPQSEVRSYRLTDGGILIGVAVNIDAQGRPNFLQFAAKPDGKDYPEFDTRSAAEYLADGKAPARTYAEIPTGDPRKVQWVDKAGGKVIASGQKWVSKDGKQLSFTVDATDPKGYKVQFLYVFDRTGP
ncbi:MAG: hypothetical protein WA825_14030 [Steroidobacteraceae bacterium]